MAASNTKTWENMVRHDSTHPGFVHVVSRPTDVPVKHSGVVDKKDTKPTADKDGIYGGNKKIRHRRSKSKSKTKKVKTIYRRSRSQKKQRKSNKSRR